MLLGSEQGSFSRSYRAHLLIYHTYGLISSMDFPVNFKFVLDPDFRSPLGAGTKVPQIRPVSYMAGWIIWEYLNPWWPT